MTIDFPPFRPHPLVRGGHLQTIAGCYLGSWVSVRGIEHHVPLWDGDWIVLHDDGPMAHLATAESKLASGDAKPDMNQRGHRKLLASG